MEHSLTKFGYDPRAEAAKLNSLPAEDRLKYFSKELLTHELHVVRNNAVSIPYFYWLTDDGKIYTNKEKTMELDIDKDERDGAYKIGIPKALWLSQTHPGQLIFHYSPPGPASFTDPPNPKYAKPYTDGQLNLIYSIGEQINVISVSVNRNEDTFLRQIFGNRYIDYVNDSIDDTEKIKKFIFNPIISPWSIDDFLNRTWSDPDMIIFHSNSLGKDHYHNLNDIMRGVYDSLSGKLKSQINAELIAYQAVTNSGSRIRQEDIDWAFKTMMGAVMKQEGVSRIVLGGGCGGGTITSSDIFGSNPVHELQQKSNLSSNYRNAVQRSDNSKSEKKDLRCPICHQVVNVDPCIDGCPKCHSSHEEVMRVLKEKAG